MGTSGQLVFTNDVSPSATGAGGALSVSWIEHTNSPVSSVNAGILVYSYDKAAVDTQSVYALIKVPNAYVAGSVINLRTTFYSPASTGTILMTTVGYLIRPTTDLITSESNPNSSGGVAFTLSAGTVNKPQSIVRQITDATGLINAIAVSAGDLIKIRLIRSGDTCTDQAFVPVYGSEVTFS